MRHNKVKLQSAEAASYPLAAGSAVRAFMGVSLPLSLTAVSLKNHHFID